MDDCRYKNRLRNMKFYYDQKCCNKVIISTILQPPTFGIKGTKSRLERMQIFQYMTVYLKNSDNYNISLR